MPALPEPADLLAAITDLADAAGREIMEVYASPFDVARKADRSPVTDADRRAEAVIVAGLRRLRPEIAVVAEEEMAAGHVPDIGGGLFWLVDPLDGTKEFVARNGEFTVNIALIRDGRPVLGVVGAPALGRMWRGAEGLGAEHRHDGGGFEPVHVRVPPQAGVAVFTSRSHGTYSDLDIWLRNNGYVVGERKISGSSLKFCLIAGGEADLYPRFGPTNEWDTAAGHAVLVAAGGDVVTEDGAPLGYGKPRFSNPWFIARGHASVRR